MTLPAILVAVALALVVGAAAWFVAQARQEGARAVETAGLQSALASAKAHAEEAVRRTSDLSAELDERQADIADLQRALGETQQDRARLEAEVAAERRAAAEKLQLLGQAEARMRDAFTALSSAALRENNQSFLALAKSSLAEFQQTARVELSGRHKAIRTASARTRRSPNS